MLTVQLLLIYSTFVETSESTLGEVDEVFGESINDWAIAHPGGQNQM